MHHSLTLMGTASLIQLNEIQTCDKIQVSTRNENKFLHDAVHDVGKLSFGCAFVARSVDRFLQYEFEALEGLGDFVGQLKRSVKSGYTCLTIPDGSYWIGGFGISVTCCMYDGGLLVFS